MDCKSRNSLSACNLTYTWSGCLKPGSYTFTAQASDAAGNWSIDGPSVDIIIPKNQHHK